MSGTGSENVANGECVMPKIPRLSHVEAWEQNKAARAKEIEAKVLRYFLDRNDETYNDAQLALDGLQAMFANGFVPNQVGMLRAALKDFRQKQASSTAQALLKAFNYFPTIIETTDTDPVVTKFETRDADLERAADELISKLRELLEVCDDKLSRKIYEQLRTLLAHLESTRTGSLGEQRAWVDLTIRTLLKVAEKQSGVEGLAIFGELVEKAFDVSGKIDAAINRGRTLLAEHFELTFGKESIEGSAQLPEKKVFLALMDKGQSKAEPSAAESDLKGGNGSTNAEAQVIITRPVGGQ